MKIIQYCQHVLGIGHFFRSLELARAFKDHEVILVLGGPRVEADLPENVRVFQLPELMMDADFGPLKAAGLLKRSRHSGRLNFTISSKKKSRMC